MESGTGIAVASGESESSARRPEGVRVDIGLTAYRRTTYIAEAIESVLAQTFDGWRLTICDNGAGGGEVAEAVSSYLADPRISYRATGRELPLAANWTNALNQGSAPYVAVLNDDDRWHPDFLRVRVEALDAHPECGFAFGECVVVDSDGVETLRAWIRAPAGVLPRVQAARWFTFQNAVAPPAILLRRSACAEVGSFFDGAWQYCDWELWARIAARFPVYYVDRQDSDFRRHTSAYTFAEREAPEQLLAMIAHLEALFTREVDGYRLSRRERARGRSRALLSAASDVHTARGWSMSAPTYRRAVREYPPALFTRASLRMLAKSLLGRRGATALARGMQIVRRQRSGSPASR